VSIEPRAITVKDCANALGVSDDLVRGLIERGELQAVRIGARVIVPVVALDDWLTRQLNPSITEDVWKAETELSVKGRNRGR
jgi:excisionase family DNA binding protein